jgi:hypothetical protein
MTLSDLWRTANHQNVGNQSAANVNPYIASNAFSPSISSYISTQSSNYSLEQMICMRMGVREGALLPFDCLKAHRCSDKVVVFIVCKDQPVMIEDDHGLFPSDALVTKLRLMLG